MQPATCSPRTRLTFALMTLILLGLPVPAWPGDTPRERVTLKGLTAIGVLVEAVNPEAERDGLTKDQLQTDVEVRLRVAGIRVIPTRGETGVPFLHLVVYTHKSAEHLANLYALSVDLEFYQVVRLERDPSVPCLASTWFVGSIGLVGAQRLQEGVRSTVADLVDKFINAYLEQNPKP